MSDNEKTLNICGVRARGLLSCLCKLPAGHKGWHQDGAFVWENGATEKEGASDVASE